MTLHHRALIFSSSLRRSQIAQDSSWRRISTTERINSDPTCRLVKGEHEFLTNPSSVVVYAGAREVPAALIQRCKFGQPALSAEVLRRIQEGTLSADSRLKKGYQKLVRAYLADAGK